MDEDFTIQSVVFHDTHLEITYVENYDKTEFVVLMKTLMVDTQKVEKELEEAMEALSDLVDAALLVKRNPPKKVRERMRDED